jgi:hypothetical protein
MRVIAATRDAALAVALVAAVCLLSYASTSYGAAPVPSARVVTAVASPAPRALSPGDSIPVQVTLTNDTGHPLDLEPRMVEGKVSSLPDGCRASWFKLTVGAGQAIVVAGDGGTAQVTGRLSFIETNTDQSACAGAALALSLSVR